MSSETALDFRFTNGVGVEEIAELFMQTNGYFAISQAWVRNHYRWIVWKLGVYFRVS